MAIAAYFVGGLVVSLREDLSGGALVDRMRNFYGVVKVVRQKAQDPNQLSLGLVQAGIEQGSQLQSAERRMEPICGFDSQSGLGRAIAHHAKRRSGGLQAPLHIGVIGLGAGTVAALGQKGDTILCYELNPAVLELSKRHFSFLKNSAASVAVLLGDGRLLLERQLSAPQSFDVLVVDAFRGASPRLHLMTKEAFAIYLAHLADDGILALNFEIDLFEMAPLHRGTARQFDVDVAWFETREAPHCYRPVSWQPSDRPISWALFARDHAFLESPAVRRAISPWPDNGRSELVWTDDSASLMSVMTWPWN